VWKPFGDTYKGKKLPPGNNFIRIYSISDSEGTEFNPDEIWLGPIRWPVIESVPQMMMVVKEYPYRQVAGLRHVYGDIMSIGLVIHFAGTAKVSLLYFHFN